MLAKWPEKEASNSSSPQGLALGIVMAGAALGGVIFPVALNRLLNDVGLSFGCMDARDSARNIFQ